MSTQNLEHGSAWPDRPATFGPALKTSYFFSEVKNTWSTALRLKSLKLSIGLNEDLKMKITILDDDTGDIVSGPMTLENSWRRRPTHEGMIKTRDFVMQRHITIPSGSTRLFRVEVTPDENSTLSTQAWDNNDPINPRSYLYYEAHMVGQTESSILLELLQESKKNTQQLDQLIEIASKKSTVFIDETIPNKTEILMAKHNKYQTSVDLGSAADYTILTKTGITTVPDSRIMGNIGVSPIAKESVTGFSLVSNANQTASGSFQVTGEVHGANHSEPTPTILTSAIRDMQTAYTDASSRLNTDAAKYNLNGGILLDAYGGAKAPLTAGVYTFGTDIQIAGDLHFDGDMNDVFILQTTGNVTQYAGTTMVLEGTVQAKNIFWQVAGYFNVLAGSHTKGNLLVKTKVVFDTLSSLHGRILCQTACTLQKATINPNDYSSK